MNPLEDLASLYVLDRLDDGERAAFEARLQREPELASLVRDLESGLARGVRALPPREPPADLLGKIEAHVDAETTSARPQAAFQPDKTARGNATAGRVKSPATTPFAMARWALAAMAAVSLAILAVQSLRPTLRPMIIVVGLDANQSTVAELPVRESARDSDDRFIQLASLAENLWEKTGEPPVKLGPASGNNRGYALFDPGSRQGFIVIEQLPVIAPNQRYHLWVVDPATARVRDAGILPLAGMNRGLYSFLLGPGSGNKSDRPNFFITVEEEDSPPSLAQPRGKTVLGRQHI
jgi:anti-sigma-K factor RskA